MKVTVSEARTATPRTLPVSASTPEGTSTARTGASAAFIASMAAAAAPATGRVSPVPKSASTTTDTPSRAGAAKGSGSTPASRIAPSMAEASRPSRPGSPTMRARTAKPASRARRATTNPSPPLFPAPHTTATRRTPGQWRTRARNDPVPARSMSSAPGSPAFLDGQALDLPHLGRGAKGRTGPGERSGELRGLRRTGARGNGAAPGSIRGCRRAPGARSPSRRPRPPGGPNAGRGP